MGALAQCGRGALVTHGLSEGTAGRVLELEDMIEEVAALEGVPAALLEGTIFVESRFRPGARSNAGAVGLMQLMPATGQAMAQELGIEGFDPFDPEDNVRAGAHFLRRLRDRYGGDRDLMHAAYFAGPGAVTKAGERVPRNAQNYVNKANRAVLWFQDLRSHCFDPEVVPAPDFRLEGPGARPPSPPKRPRGDATRKGGGGVALAFGAGLLAVGLARGRR